MQISNLFTSSFINVTACGFPIDTQVKVKSLFSTSNFKFFTGFSFDITGIFSGSNIGSPISTLAVSIFPFFAVITSVFIPASVSTVMVSFFVSPLSYTNFPTHLIPFPHISASEPSWLNICILKSAFSDGHIKINPSEPIPKCLSLTNFASSLLFSIF